MARLSFALPGFERCERPRTASVRAWRLQPGRLAHGPDEKCGMTGRMPGGFAISPILPDRCPSVGKGVPPLDLRKAKARVKRAKWSMLQQIERTRGMQCQRAVRTSGRRRHARPPCES